MSQLLLKEFVNGSEIKAPLGSVNGHRVGRKARDTRGRFQRTEKLRADSGEMGSVHRRKRTNANKRRPRNGKAWRFPARGWLTGETRDRFLIAVILGVPAAQMCAAFMRGLMG